MASGTSPPLIAPHPGFPPAQATRAGAEPPPCLIVNPRSYGASCGNLAAQAMALATAHGADIIQADRPSQLAAGLDSLLARGTRRVFVLAGDGTVHAIADHLARLPDGCPLPQLLILAGGRTNLTAADLGGHRAVLRTLEYALARSRDGGAGGLRVQYRHTLTVEQDPAPPRQGFFVAAALVDSAIRECHSHRETGSGPLRTGKLSTFWCLLQLAVLALLGRSPISCPDLDIEAADIGRLRGRIRVLIATTLIHGEGLFDPYAKRGAGPVRVTAVAARATGFWRFLPRLLTGRFSERMDVEQGYLSGRCERVEVHGLATYTMDGEKFDTDPTRPVVIRSGLRIGFLTP